MANPLTTRFSSKGNHRGGVNEMSWPYALVVPLQAHLTIARLLVWAPHVDIVTHEMSVTSAKKLISTTAEPGIELTWAKVIMARLKTGLSWTYHQAQSVLPWMALVVPVRN